MKKQNKTGSIGVVGATAIGVGGMMGAGLYTLLGLAANSAGVWLPVSFLIGGIVAAFFSLFVFKVRNEVSRSRRCR